MQGCTPVTDTLRRRALAGLGWSYGSTAARIAIQFAAGVVLARLLGPSPFGIAAAAWALVGAGSQFVDCGFGSALIQRETISPAEIRFAFTMQLTAGAILTAITALAASPLAALAGNPAIAPAIRLLSAALLIQAVSQTPNCLLRRSLDFKTQQLAQLAGAALGQGLIAIPMAAAGFGAASLIAGQLAQLAIVAVIVHAKVRQPIAPLFRPPGPALLEFGSKAMAANLVNWTIAGLDSLALSRFFGLVPAGLYNRAQTLAVAPAASFVQVIQSVLFPAYSRGAANPDSVRRAYHASLGIVTAVVAPAAAVIAVASKTFATGIFGHAWASAADFLTPLALVMPLSAIMGMSGPLLWARGKVGSELGVQAITLICLTALLALAVRSDAPAIAWAVLASSLIRALGMLWRTLPAAGSTWADCARVLAGPALLAVISAAAAVAADNLLAPATATHRLLAIAATTGPLIAACGPFLLPREARELIRTALPARLAWGQTS